jgi:ATP-dependent protease ClpP protease subunit
MRMINSPIVTVIVGKACSMAGLVSLAGKVKLMTENSIWMAHDATAGDHDYVTKMIDRTEYYKELQKQLFAYLTANTKLSQKELSQARNGELWLNPRQCKEKGIVDQVMIRREN